MRKIAVGVLELVWNLTHFVGLVVFGTFWIIWAIGVEGFIKLREVWNKIDSTMLICFAVFIYIEMGLFYYAKAQLG